MFLTIKTVKLSKHHSWSKIPITSISLLHTHPPADLSKVRKLRHCLQKRNSASYENKYTAADSNEKCQYLALNKTITQQEFVTDALGATFSDA